MQIVGLCAAARNIAAEIVFHSALVSVAYLTWPPVEMFRHSGWSSDCVLYSSEPLV